MQRRLKLATLSLTAFYTICSALTAHADVENSPSLTVFNQINQVTKSDLADSVELVFDYIFALNEEKKSPTECVSALLALCKKDESNSVFRHGPVFAQHWLIALKDFRVNDTESMKLLHRALSTDVSSGPQNIPRKSAELLLNLGREVSKVETPTPELKKIKVLTIWQLALLAQTDKEFGRQLGTLALEQMADCVDVPEVERRDALFRVTYSYNDERPQGKGDGDLLFRNALAAAKMVNHSKNKYDFQNLMYLYNQMFRRCSYENALAAQAELTEAARSIHVDPNTLHIMLLELGCAYIRAGKFEQAEAVLSKQIEKPGPMDQLCLAESLRKQRKYAQADKLALQIAKTPLSFEARYPSLYIAMSNALRAQVLIDQKNYHDALPLLLAADTWFGNTVSQENMEMREFPFVDHLIPDDITVLSNLALVYEKIGRNSDSLRTRQALAKVKKEKQTNILTIEKDALTNATQSGVDTERTINQARRMVEICHLLEKDPKKCAQLILDYGESLIRHGKTKSAEVCLDDCDRLSTVTANEAQIFRARISADRILIAEELGDVGTAGAKLKDFMAKDNSAANDLRIAEVESRLALMTGDYALAENKSRRLETALEATSTYRARQYEESARDKFVKANVEAILDRVQVLNQLQNYKQAAKLARLLLLTQNNLYDRTAADTAANLAFAYVHSGHKGLAEALECEAAFKDRASYPMPPSRYMMDATEKLAALSEMRNNSVRARRYRAEAKSINLQ